jgi:hypothetical protein
MRTAKLSGDGVFMSTNLGKTAIRGAGVGIIGLAREEARRTARIEFEFVA